MAFEYSFSRYLEAKKTVDDRALNRIVMEQLRAELAAQGPNAVNALEVGGGVGTMLARLLEHDLLRRTSYRLVDLDAGLLARAPDYLAKWAGEAGWEAREAGKGALTLQKGDRRCNVHTQTADVYSLGAADTDGRDLLVANALLDLLDLERAVPALMGLLRPGGLFYFTINYDGGTIFEPVFDPALEETIMRLYNLSMDQRVTDGLPSGDSRTGRHLFATLRAADVEVLASGSSDWVVFPQAGRYPADEGYFLHHIVETVQRELKGRPELDPETLESWGIRRHRQIEDGALVYIAHQLDFLGRR
ncbi:MAG: class I SAM-dependent methyltransferase [Chloroflexi bacterium]|nr:class I SAM-dependent methyltransferase [Chloroflexota bacterium]